MLQVNNSKKKVLLLCAFFDSVLHVCVQVGESFGPVRALAEGKPGELFVGTTKNAIIRAAFPDTLTPIVQVHADNIHRLTSNKYFNFMHAAF